jgi:flagellar biosynthesis/type III secretory pathway protein FliH
MAILRSRATLGQAEIANPGVASAIREWETRLVAARETGRLAGLQEASARITEAERRAATAEARADEGATRRQAEFLARFEPVLATISSAAARLEPLEKQLVQESEAEIVRLSLAVAAAVLRQTVALDAGWMQEVVRHALLQTPDRRAIVIRMNPTDAASLQERIKEISARIAGIERLEVVEDATLARGSCILQSRGTRLDTSLAGCWERLASQLIDLAPSSDCTLEVRAGDARPPGAGRP